MIFWLLAYLGGALTILSPCILPVLPFVFSSAEQPFRKSGLPLLAGMALTFTLISTLAVAGGSWVIHANEWGRWIALVLLMLFALTLLSPAAAEWVSRPFVKLGGSLRQTTQEERGAVGSFLLGVATGFLWAPCAGPILGLILTGAAIRGASAGTTGLLLAYALGAATSLSLALAAGGKLLKSMKRYLGADVWVRRGLGICVLLGALAIALGWDRGTLTRISRLRTETLEQRLIGLLHPPMPPNAIPSAGSVNILSALTGATGWQNSPPLSAEFLRGKVVLIDFWTYSCINCLRTLPYLKAWNEKYKDLGLVIIGVHTPEFAFEKNPDNVRKAVKDLGIAYPVALDSDYAIWTAFNNQYWPAHYFIDGSGMLRHKHFGEGEYEESETVIRKLLTEVNPRAAREGLVQVSAEGALAASSGGATTPETYLGYSRSANQIALPGLARDTAAVYEFPRQINSNQWSLGGKWIVRREDAESAQTGAKIVFRFHARDVHLVLGPAEGKKAVRFIVRLDGMKPVEHHGSDIDAEGKGQVNEQRLYQLIRLNGRAKTVDHIFEIEFLDPGVQAYAFTFG